MNNTKLVLITGGSKGLGQALVELYAGKNWVVREFSRSGTTKHHVECDFSNPESSVAALNNTLIELSTVEWDEIVLINNVGTLSPIGPIQMDDPREWQENLQVNLNSCVVSTGLFLKHFESQNSNRYIANISSGAASKSYFGWSLYCASKAGMEAFTRCVAVEQSRCESPTQCFIVNPGLIDTEMQVLIRSQKVDRFESLQRFKQLETDGKLQPPSIVAKAIELIIKSSPAGGEFYDVCDYF